MHAPQIHKAAAPGKAPPAEAAQAPSKQPKLGGGYEQQAAALTPGAQPVGMPDPKAVVRELLAQGITSENEITNELFYRANEVLRGTKLKANTPEAKQWLSLRDAVVRPEMAAAKKATKPDKDPDKKPEDPAIDEPAPAPAPAPEEAEQAKSKPSGGSSKASMNDAYKNQNDNSYDDDLANWKGDSAGKNTCNMTALTMALISIAGEDKAREAVVAWLRKKGPRSGATAKVGGKKVLLTKVLKDDALLAKVQLEDLVIAVAVASGDSYGTVTKAHTILGIAKKTGLVKGGSTKGTQQYLSKPEVRQAAKEALDRGARIVAQTKGHYVYLTAVRDDGIVVHDPAGARVTVSGDSNLWPGTLEAKLGTWLGRLDSDARRQTALRRTSLEPSTRPFMERACAAATMKGDAKKAEKDKLKAEFPGYLDLGKNNFYALSELDEYKCRLGITLEPSDSDKEADKTQAGGE
ncbi:MAG: hypothetical protein IT385_16770 [Deltaproteobacteria bacterium]|nr:hypothetical protein [Deltaproteobacteria bacterium]